MNKVDWSKAPEGATHAFLDNYDGPSPFFKVFHDRIFHYDGEKFSEMPNPSLFFDDWLKSRIYIQERPTEWNGTGLPPVGTECEIAASTPHQTVSWPEGTKVKVYANFTDDRGVELAAFVDAIGSVGGVAVAKCFRPIRTPEQIAAEEREKAVIEMLARSNSCGTIPRRMCEAIYDAGYRLQENQNDHTTSTKHY
jgi:hypothetical protein